jgi:U3 small nucleolar RNA-associated protein 15
VLAMGVSGDNTILAVGTASGMLSMRARSVTKPQAEADKKSKANLKAGTYRYFLRGGGAGPAVEDFRVASGRKQRLQPYDVKMKKFEYGAALDAALESKQPIIVASVLDELINRDGLGQALSGRDEAALEPLLHYLGKYITDPRYATVLVDVCDMLFDLYVPVLGQSVSVDSLFYRLRSRVHEEITFQRQLLTLQGALDGLLAASAGASATGAATDA